MLFTVLDLNESSAKDVKASLSESAEDKRERGGFKEDSERERACSASEQQNKEKGG